MKTLRKILFFRRALALGTLGGLLALAAPVLADEPVDDAPDSPAVAAAIASADDGAGDASGGQGYGYVRLVEGAATLTPAGGDEAAAAEVNQPVLAGDRVSVPRHAKVEILLADQNILRVDGGSELILERLAASPDRQDRATVLRLLSGNIQLIVTTDSLGDELPRVETANATIYPQYFGAYRLTADEGYSQVVVRSGTAKMVTDNGSWTVKADEEAVIDEHTSPDHQAEVREAGPFDTLERWGRQLDDEYAAAGPAPESVDENLRYAAAPLTRYGAWINVGGVSYWRPRVDGDWRPYWQGRWIYTPSGLTWVSSEPWGWVPFHYGSWDNLPGYGWVWQPGSVWSPAWVYWYWGADYAGWCPTGYYTRYYGGIFGDVGFHFGLYGWAGGGWGLYDHWNFVSTSYFSSREGYRQGYRDGYWDAHRDVQRFAVPADARTHGELGRGILTTNTKPLRPSVWKDPGGAVRALRGKSPAELPDVTPFVARRQTLSTEVIHRVVTEKPQGLDGTPLRPSTLGRPARTVQVGGPGALGGAPGRTAPGANGGARQPVGVRGGRPGLEADGGAPNPRVSGDRGPATARPSVHGAQPGQRERRPAPEADGGAPRPVRQPEVRGARPPQSSSPDVRGSRSPERSPERQPAVKENRPPERQPAVREKPPEHKAEEKDKKPPRS
jgi:hypothetical protein